VRPGGGFQGFDGMLTSPLVTPKKKRAALRRLDGAVFTMLGRVGDLVPALVERGC